MDICKLLANFHLSKVEISTFARNRAYEALSNEKTEYISADCTKHPPPAIVVTGVLC